MIYDVIQSIISLFLSAFFMNSNSISSIDSQWQFSYNRRISCIHLYIFGQIVAWYCTRINYLSLINAISSMFLIAIINNWQTLQCISILNFWIHWIDMNLFIIIVAMTQSIGFLKYFSPDSIFTAKFMGAFYWRDMFL